MLPLASLLQGDTSASAIVALLTTSVAAVALLVLFAKPDDKKSSRIQSLPSWRPIVGDFPEFTRNAARMHEWMVEKTLAFDGKPWRIHMPGIRTLIVVTEPELVEEVTATQFHNFPRGQKQITISEDLFGKSIITSNGEMWYHQRKAATKFFTAKALRLCMATTMRKNMNEVYDVVDGSIASGDSIDMLKLFHEFALQTFAEVGLGVDLKLIGNQEHHPMETAIEESTPILLRRVRLPTFYWKLERWLKIGPEKGMAEALTSARAWLNTIVAECLEAASKRQHAAEESEVKSVVELFLAQSAEDKEGLRAEDLVDFIWTFILGSRGTSALALTWVFLMVAKHPRVEQRLRAEMAAAFSDLDADSTYLTSEHVSKLTYLEATIKETLRLYPTIPINQKMAAKDTVIGDGVAVNKGDVVAMHTYSMARLPSLWGPDAAEFKPERWIDEKTGELITVSNTKYAAFGSGPRICIGMKLAMLELRVVTVNLLNRYRFSLATPNDCGHVVSIELMPATRVVMHATRIAPKTAAA